MSNHRFRLFVPIIAGATLKDRALACVGALLGIAATAAVTSVAVGHDASLPAIVAPMGASAVLLFAVPSSPMAQPWPVVGGNAISALVGVTVALTVEPMPLAAGLAVALAILAMTLTRSLHPPGGAAALTAVIGGHAVRDLGFLFPFVPTALNAALLLLAGYVFHRLVGRTYPHVAIPPNPHGTSDPPAAMRGAIKGEDVDRALESLGESFDIDREDLVALLAEVEWRAAMRTGGSLTCADVMSRDVIHVSPDAGIDDARALLVRHNIRMLPVMAETGELLGSVGLRQVLSGEGSVGDVMTTFATATAETPIANLLPTLTDGSTHAVVIVDASGLVQGVVTQTDVMASMARALVSTGSKAG